MSRNDLLSDSLAGLKNAIVARKEEMIIPHSNFLFRVLEILKQEGYIENLRKIEENKRESIKVYLKYKNKRSVISGVRRISKPSRRTYVKKDEVPWVLKGRGLALISTSQGLLVDKQARKKGLGGEVLFHIW